MLTSTQVREILVNHFPNCFMHKGQQKKPLKEGIGLDIKECLPSLTESEIKEALADYAGGPTYHNNVVKGKERVNLMGQPFGVVSKSNENYSKYRIRELRRKWKRMESQTQLNLQ